MLISSGFVFLELGEFGLFIWKKKRNIFIFVCKIKRENIFIKKLYFI